MLYWEYFPMTSTSRCAVIALPGLDPGIGRAIHMWTAPGPQEVVQRADRIACDHMSGLLMRSHMTAAKMGFAT